MKMNQSKENQSGCSEQKENEGIDLLIEELRGYICDKICGLRELTVADKEMVEICNRCRIGELTEQIKTEYDEINSFEKSSLHSLMEKYRDITLCRECGYRKHEEDCQGGEYYWCRNEQGLDGNLEEYEGCSRGRRG